MGQTIVLRGLPGDEVAVAMMKAEIWRIPLATPTPNPILSPEESARAARFIFEKDRQHYTVAHTAVRQILARYTNQSPQAIQIQTAEKGKPYLPGHPQIHFNLSHSGAYALLAISNRELGVDIERINPERSTLDIAKRFFAPQEVQNLLTQPEASQTEAFFNIWSRKEAYIKARGEGLGIPLDSFAVSLGPEAELLHAPDRDRWSLHALRAPEGYAAALAIECPAGPITQLIWTQEP